MSYIPQFTVTGGDYPVLELSDRIPKNLSIIDLLDASIAKWQFLVNYIAETGTIPDCGGRQTCALCWEFWSFEKCTCCPIRQYTGESSCENTPYLEYFRLSGVSSPPEIIDKALTAANQMLILLQTIKTKIQGE